MFQFRAFPSYDYFIHRTILRYCLSGFPHSEISGYIAYLQLPEAYRSLSRPSSAPSAKAFPLRSFLLDLIRLRHRLKRQSAEMVLNHIAVLRIMQASTEVLYES